MSKFQQYRVFIATVETGSLSGAANRLNVSPSAVSKQINQLEHSLNATLFERSNRNVKVTEQGKSFFIHCKSIISQINNAEQTLLDNKNSVAGRISITMSKSLNKSLIFDAFTAFLDEYPDILYDFKVSDIIYDLFESDIDFSFRLGRIDDSSRVICIPLADVRLVFCATSDYLKRFGIPRKISELEIHRVITQPDLTYSKEVRQFFKNIGFNPNNRNFHYSDDIDTVHQCVRTGLGIGLMLDYSVMREVSSQQLIQVLPEIKIPAKKLYLLYKKDSRLSLKLNLFIESVKGHFTSG